MCSIVRGSSINGSASIHQSFQMYISLEQFCCSLYDVPHHATRKEQNRRHFCAHRFRSNWKLHGPSTLISRQLYPHTTTRANPRLQRRWNYKPERNHSLESKDHHNLRKPLSPHRTNDTSTQRSTSNPGNTLAKEMESNDQLAQPFHDYTLAPRHFCPLSCTIPRP